MGSFGCVAFSIDYVDFGNNLRSYYPDFVARDSSGGYWLIETKGMESAEVSQKDSAAKNWCENASALTKTQWNYRKVPQKGLKSCSPKISSTWQRYADFCYLTPPHGCHRIARVPHPPEYLLDISCAPHWKAQLPITSPTNYIPDS